MSAIATTTGTTLEVLAPLLPFGPEMQYIRESDIFACDEGERSKLVSLNAIDQHRARLLLVNGSRIWVPVNDVLPVLYSFECLVKPLPDGTVPIKRVAELELQLVIDPARHAVLDASGIWIARHEGERNGHYFAPSWLRGGSMSLDCAKYLRHHHFAVGLEPHQYIRKTN